MSKDKGKSWGRQREILERAVRWGSELRKYPGYEDNPGYVGIHCQGGMAHADPDLQKLLKAGLMRFERVTITWGAWAKRKQSRAVMTPAGYAALGMDWPL